jgi:hypothetical protein
MIFLCSFIALKKMVPESGHKLYSLSARIGLLHLLSVKVIHILTKKEKKVAKKRKKIYYYYDNISKIMLYLLI